MKRVRQTPAGWQFQLLQNEVNYLRLLVGMFPFGEPPPVNISNADQSPEAAERESLLGESLAEHRKQLKQFARKFIAGQKWEQHENGLLLTLDAESRETLLQILNDVRVACWHALGEPESLGFPDASQLQSMTQEMGWRCALEMAGYFECALLEPEE